MSKQHTIKNTVHMAGKGLHSGLPVYMTLKPARVNTGIVFQRTDGNYSNVRVGVNNVQQTPLCTVLVADDNQISTIEHLMAALCAMQVDNIIIELDAPEVPVMDGSSEPFVFLLESGGFKEQSIDRHIIVVNTLVKVEDGDRFVSLEPCDCLRFELSISFDHPVIKATPQSVGLDISPMAFTKSVSRARTFGFAKDLEYLHQNNRALGASLDNTIGIDDNGVMNPEGLRYPDEFARHKLLDAIGDLYVSGSIKGLYKAHKPSHTLNNQLLRKLLRSN